MDTFNVKFPTPGFQDLFIYCSTWTKGKIQIKPVLITRKSVPGQAAINGVLINKFIRCESNVVYKSVTVMTNEKIFSNLDLCLWHCKHTHLEVTPLQTTLFHNKFTVNEWSIKYFLHSADLLQFKILETFHKLLVAWQNINDPFTLNGLMTQNNDFLWPLSICYV